MTNTKVIVADKIQYVSMNDDYTSFDVHMDNGSCIHFVYDDEEECIQNYETFAKRLKGEEE